MTVQEACRQYQLAVEHERRAHAHGTLDDIEHAQLETALARDRLAAVIAADEAARWPDTPPA